MTPAKVQKVRSAIALLRSHGENDAADELLDVVDPKVAPELVPGDEGYIPSATLAEIAEQWAQRRRTCPHTYVSSRSGCAEVGTDAVCAACGKVLGRFAWSGDGGICIPLTSGAPPDEGPPCGYLNEDPERPGYCYCGRTLAWHKPAPIVGHAAPAPPVVGKVEPVYSQLVPFDAKTPGLVVELNGVRFVRETPDFRKAPGDFS